MSASPIFAGLYPANFAIGNVGGDEITGLGGTAGWPELKLTPGAGVIGANGGLPWTVFFSVQRRMASARSFKGYLGRCKTF